MVSEQKKEQQESQKSNPRNVIEIKINVPQFNARNLRRFVTHLEKAGKEILAAGNSFFRDDESDSEEKMKKIEIK
ncbi:MAG: hypothetical protein M1616_05030 [Candidatus Thermoplasmatota archaeon]|jgi:hypothetical protein|nr:hypothetical protein [Candidatus Thermoplasmatota archaeon]